MEIEWDFSELYKFAENLGNSVRIEEAFKKITKEIAEVLLKDIRKLTPKGETGKLIKGWDGNDFLVSKVKNGYMVKIVNTTDYARSVNDGHPSHNQYNKGGEPYIVHSRKKVTSPYQWQKGDPSTWVYGQFFVERGILQLKNTQEIESIIMRELQKWWEGCF